MSAFVEVTKDAFFRAIGGPENIHPRSERDCSIWEIVGTRRTVGKSLPGYASPPNTASKYLLDPDFLRAKEGR